MLASLAAQKKKNIEGGDLKRPEGGVVLVLVAPPTNMMHVLAHGGPVTLPKSRMQEVQAIC